MGVTTGKLYAGNLTGARLKLMLGIKAYDGIDTGPTVDLDATRERLPLTVLVSVALMQIHRNIHRWFWTKYHWVFTR